MRLCEQPRRKIVKRFTLGGKISAYQWPPYDENDDSAGLNNGSRDPCRDRSVLFRAYSIRVSTLRQVECLMVTGMTFKERIHRPGD
jgi:hypothetical protein